MVKAEQEKLVEMVGVVKDKPVVFFNLPSTQLTQAELLTPWMRQHCVIVLDV
jgi:hypothetical protein